MAQWLEQWTHNPLVVGSNPTGPSRNLRFCLSLYSPGRMGLKTVAIIHLQASDVGGNREYVGRL